MRVFVTQPVVESALTRLRTMAEVTVNPDGSRVIAKDKLIAGARACDILFSLLHDPVDREVITANPALRAITSMSITPDNIDVKEATARRIPVHLLGAGVHGKTIGLVGGRGRIGQAVAARARGFSMRILYCGPRPMEEADARRLEAAYVPLERLLAESDFVSLHPQLTAATRHMIGAREFSLMKPTAYLINTSRGAVVDEAALTAALADRRIAGAGLDVFENEPHVAQALTGLANVVLTPHLGSAVVEVRTAMAETVVDNIAAILAGRRPPNIVNPEVLAP